MATLINDKGVIVIDAAADNIVPSGTIVKVRKIRWIGGTTAAHLAEITDAGGTVAKWRDMANAANYVAESDYLSKQLILSGLRVLTLQSGVLFIYAE